MCYCAFVLLVKIEPSPFGSLLRFELEWSWSCHFFLRYVTYAGAGQVWDFARLVKKLHLWLGFCLPRCSSRSDPIVEGERLDFGLK